jgi:hypothetical protein
MKPVIIKNFFSEDLMNLIRMQLIFFKDGTLPVEVDNFEFFRMGVHNPDLLKALHILMVDRAAEIFGEKVKKSYVYLSMYNDERSICPPHTDRPQCKFTVDLCIDQKVPWGIFVDGEEYFLNPGDALCYSGTDSPHYRNKIEKGNFCDLAFFHFVQEEFNGGLD